MELIAVACWQLTGILRGLSLRVIEICRNSDNCIGDFGPKISLCSFLHFGQNHGGNLIERTKKLHMNTMKARGWRLVRLRNTNRTIPMRLLNEWTQDTLTSSAKKDFFSPLYSTWIFGRPPSLITWKWKWKQLPSNYFPRRPKKLQIYVLQIQA